MKAERGIREDGYGERDSLCFTFVFDGGKNSFVVVVWVVPATILP